MSIDTLEPRLKGAPNFRDIGGLPTTDGRRVAHGRMFRSGHFERLTDSDEAVLAALELRLVVDLRSKPERALDRRRWPEPGAPTVLNLDVNTNPQQAAAAFAERLATEPTAAGARAAMLDTYARLPDAFVGYLPRFFEAVTENGALPAVFHCHAGKDRTGFLAAMLLSALGVEEDAIVADYTRTAAMQDREELIAHFIDRYIGRDEGFDWRAVAEVAVDAAPDFLSAAYAAIDREHGSVERYLANVGGLDAGGIERLRAALLV